MAKVRYNERSWAIDVISEINLFLSNKSWYFKSASGEVTIRNDKSSLFPDILIFKDQKKDVILQGWELKMPDTPINDPELVRNAIIKAKILQRNSFILWNVKSAVLYIEKDGNFSILKAWDEIPIKTRLEVKSNEDLWKNLLYMILRDLNNYFETEDISDNDQIDIISVDNVIDVVLENQASTMSNIKNKVRRDAQLDALINMWWLSSSLEYGDFNSKDTDLKYLTLSKVILTDWVFKIIFAHVLKRHINEAKAIESINFDTSVSEAIQIICNISQRCNFWNIFRDNLAINLISPIAWTQIVQLNLFLTTINIETVEIDILHNLLQSLIVAAKRKVAGQYATPVELAQLLTRLTVSNKNGIVIDPCCGTGTIIKQVALLKEEYNIPANEIRDSVWASDKHSYPIQLSTLTLADPDNIGEVLNIFTKDVIDLKVGLSVSFKDPNDGHEIEKKLPCFDYIVSNLPFIKSKEIKLLNPNITDINEIIKDQIQVTNRELLSGKSDIFAYIPFYLHNLISDDGKIGLILSNAWLGTEYGEIFLNLFQRYFDIEIVAISGKGKWFKNADVVATILIAAKRDPQEIKNSEKLISFCTLKTRIQEVSDVKLLSSSILLGQSSELVCTQSYNINQIKQLEEIGIPWSAYFANLDWLPLIASKLVNASCVFNFTRGERRGWNELFYPTEGHGIEAHYIQPILKNLRHTEGLICVADAEAFCCSQSISALKKSNHTGALNWIRAFEKQTNQTGIPLTKCLSRPSMHWYEMKSNNLADYVANVNYDKSLFIAKFAKRSFIDQRMIGLSIRESYQSEDSRLILALLNSILTMFFIESFGFGRGLGALDLRASRFEKDFKILDIKLLDDLQKIEIIKAFEPIIDRKRLPLEMELLQDDRLEFERILFHAFGISEYYDSIKDSLLHLYRIRFAVKD